MSFALLATLGTLTFGEKAYVSAGPSHKHRSRAPQGRWEGEGGGGYQVGPKGKELAAVRGN